MSLEERLKQAEGALQGLHVRLDSLLKRLGVVSDPFDEDKAPETLKDRASSLYYDLNKATSKLDEIEENLFVK